MKINITEKTAVEPVSLAEAKAWMRVDYGSEDAIITSLIKTARTALERYLGISIIEKEITINAVGVWLPFAIPYQPVLSVDVIKVNDSEIDTPTDLVIRSNNVQTVNIELEYTAGFTTVPEPLKHAIKEMVHFYFDNRGSIASIPGSVLPLIQTYNANLL
jgi:hypothetical protein